MAYHRKGNPNNKFRTLRTQNVRSVSDLKGLVTGAEIEAGKAAAVQYTAEQKALQSVSREQLLAIKTFMPRVREYRKARRLGRKGIPRGIPRDVPKEIARSIRALRLV